MRKRRFSLFGSLAFRIILIALLLYLGVSHFLVSTFRIESVSMSPTLAPADRVVASTLAYGARVPFSTARLPGLRAPSRGDLVVVRPPWVDEGPFVRRLFEPLAAFFTVQKATLHRDLYGARAGGSLVKRLVGLPGDTVRMRNYKVFIKPSGSTQFVPDSELLGVEVSDAKVVLPKGWDESLPLSGTAPDIVLGEDQYFVLGDNRQQSSDSRSWGPIPWSRIQALVIYRYWPPAAMGRP